MSLSIPKWMEMSNYGWPDDGLYSDDLDILSKTPSSDELIALCTEMEEQRAIIEEYCTEPSWKSKYLEDMICPDSSFLIPSLHEITLNGKRLPYPTLPAKEKSIDLARYTIMVNPKTGVRVSDPFKHEDPEDLVEQQTDIGELPEDMLEELEPKPYHPTLDHNYWMSKTCVKEVVNDEQLKTKEEIIDENVNMVVEELFNSADEPVVDVWEIENFTEEQVKIEKPRFKQMASRVSQVGLPYKNETRRSSRTAEKVRRAQARKISHAIHAHLKVNQKKPRNARQYNKNRRPKNSVETTPSQSDVDEWNVHPMRPTYTKLTKKKTSKGRIDHSESERHRREVLRTNFDCLSRLVPMKYMIGDKVSSQISKQKILVGAKIYILALRQAKRQAKRSMRPIRRKYQILLDKCEKRISSKLLKFTKKHK